MKCCSKFWCVGAVGAVLTCGAVQPLVENVAVSQDAETRVVTIAYDLAEADAIITLDFQTNTLANGTGQWVSIGGEHQRSLGGDVNCKVVAGTGKVIKWMPDIDWEDHAVDAGGLRAEVKAWTENNPPDYWAIDLSTTKRHLYYPNVEALPDGIESDRWRMGLILMRRIPAKNVVWQMGSDSNEVGRNEKDFERPHKVKLSHDYYLGVFEYTQCQAMMAMAGGNSQIIRAQFTNMTCWATRPEEYADLVDAPGYRNNTDPTSSDPAVRHASDSWKQIGRLRILSGLGIYFDLPTEAQWEYACRAGTTSMFNDGSSDLAAKWGTSAALNKLARYRGTVADVDADFSCDTSSGTARVGSYEPNKWGLYDMHGNVAELCLDWSRSFTNVTEDVWVDPYGFDKLTDNGEKNYYRVAKGGSYASYAYECRAAARGSAQIYAPNSKYGARLCYTLVNDDTDTEGSTAAATLAAALVTSRLKESSLLSTPVPYRTDPEGTAIIVR